jgi:hypothetical protein
MGGGEGVGLSNQPGDLNGRTGGMQRVDGLMSPVEAKLKERREREGMKRRV